MKKPFLLSAAAVLFALMMAGCSGTDAEQAPSDGVTITVMGRKSDMAKSYMTAIFQAYEEKTGNRIEPIAIEDTQFEASAAESFASGDVPDIFMHFHNADLYRFDVKENFLPLNDQPWVDELTDGTLAYCTDSEGDVLGLPYWENSVSGCYYNKTILDELGLMPATTQNEFDMLCQALADAGYTPICWPAAGGAWMVQFALDPIFADEPELLQKLNSGKTNYADIPQVASLIQWIDSAADRGWFGKDYFTCELSDVSTVMSSGQAVMTFIWDTWFYTDLARDDQYTVDDFALMPVFLNTADAGTYEGGNLNMMMVSKNSPHVDACLDFLSFCATPENYNAAFDGISTVSCFKNQTTNIQSPMVTNMSDSIDKYLRPSTAASKIKGYSDDDVTTALKDLFLDRVSPEGCIELLDDSRLSRAGMQNAPLL